VSDYRNFEYLTERPVLPKTWETIEVDPVTFRVIGGAFNAIVEQMAQTIFRGAYSNIIRECEDLGASIIDPLTREIAESKTTPLHNGTLQFYLRGILRVLGSDINPGDVIIHNHPYLGATHSPDVGVVTPIFYEDRLIAFCGVTGHLIDTGGAAPGLNVDVFDVWAEAKLYAALKLYEGGKRNETLWRHMHDNVRTATMNAGDLEALIAACFVGQKRFVALLDRYGVDTVMSSAEHWMDYSERILRQEIEKVPDGRYEAPVQWLDDDGRNRDVRLPVHCAVEIEGSDITVDLTGSADQVETAFNVTFEGTLVPAVYYMMHCIFLDEARWGAQIPHNDGLFRPIHVEAPEGSIFKPRFPAALCARSQQPILALDSINLALNQVIPEQTTAGNPGHCHVMAYTGYSSEDSQYWVYVEPYETNSGARAGKDGLDCIDGLLVNSRNNPIEDMEWRFPLRCERYEINDTPPAPGRWRGGLGVVKRIRFLVDGFISSEGDRMTDWPKAVHGGRDGSSALAQLDSETGETRRLPGKVTGQSCDANDVVELRSATGAGWGSPLEREPLAVWHDFQSGYFDAEHARAEYGVVLDDDSLDLEATESLRAELGAGDVATADVAE
jgi:N-methylhydantoinase B/oxoprolinase/acetone carboxylase alpha subunit